VFFNRITSVQFERYLGKTWDITLKAKSINISEFN